MVSFPFDSKITGYDNNNYPIYDRAVDSSLLSNVINEFVSTGVFIKESGGFSVVAGDGMTVVVSPGSAIIKGTTCIENEERTLTVQAADTNYDRIDSIVLRYNNNEDVRAIDLYILQGTASSSPVQPALTREGAIYEIAIANIYIPVNSVAISNERITDTRGDSSRCGWATGVSQDFMESINNRFALVNQSIVDNSTKINDNSNKINNNTTRINNNTTKINNNTTEIRKHATAIADNSNKINDNTTKINNNTTAINNNTTAINNNTAAIAKNTHKLEYLIKHKVATIHGSDLYYSGSFGGLPIESTGIDGLYEFGGYIKIPELTIENKIINVTCGLAYADSECFKNIYISEFYEEGKNVPSSSDNVMFHVRFNGFSKDFIYDSSKKVTMLEYLRVLYV